MGDFPFLFLKSVLDDRHRMRRKRDMADDFHFNILRPSAEEKIQLFLGFKKLLF